MSGKRDRYCQLANKSIVRNAQNYSLSRISLKSDKSRAKGGEKLKEFPKQAVSSKLNDGGSSISHTMSLMEGKLSSYSYNVCHFINCRENGLSSPRGILAENNTRYLLTHGRLRETEIHLGGVNTILCSKWASDRHIVFGSKCNKLLIYDVNAKDTARIPLLHSISSNFLEQSSVESGVHALDINPSRKLLATSTDESINIAVYRLPNFAPLCIGEDGHKDSIMSLSWINDQIVVSGSKDSTVAVWRTPSDEDSDDIAQNKQIITKPISSIKCDVACRGIRSMCFNMECNDIATLSFNGHVNIFDADTFKKKHSRKIPFSPDSVCITYHREGFYAVGCRLYILLLDFRTLETIKKITTRYSGCGIRAVSFQGNILTIGTGLGMLLFYDVRAGKYVENSESANGIATLKCSKGTVYSIDDLDGFELSRYAPTIYTHCYDKTGLKLFTAGGPASSSLVGNYAGVWQ